MYDLLHGIILSLICATGFLAVFHLMEISSTLKILARLSQENNAMLRALIAHAQRDTDQIGPPE